MAFTSIESSGVCDAGGRIELPARRRPVGDDWSAASAGAAGDRGPGGRPPDPGGLSRRRVRGRAGRRLQRRRPSVPGLRRCRRRAGRELDRPPRPHRAARPHVPVPRGDRWVCDHPRLAPLRHRCLVRLFLAENGWETTREHAFGNPFPFTKRLRSYLDDEQNALLASLPPLVATIDAGIDGYVALARIFLPRARALAARTGATWPEAYERASVGFFERMLGVSLDL